MVSTLKRRTSKCRSGTSVHCAQSRKSTVNGAGAKIADKSNRSGDAKKKKCSWRFFLIIILFRSETRCSTFMASYLNSPERCRKVFVDFASHKSCLFHDASSPCFFPMRNGSMDDQNRRFFLDFSLFKFVSLMFIIYSCPSRKQSDSTLRWRAESMSIRRWQW